MNSATGSLLDAQIDRQYLGRRALLAMGIEAVDGRTCMDWSERRLHIAGPLGKSLAQVFLSRKWLQRDARTRAVRLTPEGTESLRSLLGLNITDIQERGANEGVD